MFLFEQSALIEVLENSGIGVAIVSYGRPRDGFELAADMPFFTSGFGGKYEMVHTNVPAGVMVAVGNLDSLDVTNFETMKQQLAVIDIYPTGHSGNFAEVLPQKSRDWFFGCSRLDNDVNNQVAISHARILTPAGLEGKYDELVEFLADNMHVFKDSNKGGALTPAAKGERQKIVIDLLNGLSQTIRYTRLDEPAKAFQIGADVMITKDGAGKAEIYLGLTEAHKILVLRTHKNGAKDITPLDRAMLGRTYVTQDGQPLGTRGTIDLGEVMQRVEEIEARQAAPRPDFLRRIIDSQTAGAGTPQR